MTRVVRVRYRQSRFSRMCIALLWSTSLCASELSSAEMERLGRLSGEVLLHASVLKRLASLCPVDASVGDPMTEMERDVAKMPDDFQSAFSLQRSTAPRVGDLIARDLVKKSGGCGSESLTQERAKVAAALEQALRRWRVR